MAQSTLIDIGSFTTDNLTKINANFSELYMGTAVTAGSSLAAMAPNGLTTVNSTNGTTFALGAPLVGRTKYIECVGATANVTISTTAAAATIGAAASSLTHIVFTAADQAIHLVGETTAKWVRIAQNSSLVTVTT